MAQSKFWARLSSYAAPFIQKFQSDLSTLIKFQSYLVKYLFRLLESIRNGCSAPDRRSVWSSRRQRAVTAALPGGERRGAAGVVQCFPRGHPAMTCAAKAFTAAITGCDRAAWIFLCWILNPPELPAFTMSPSREFHRLNIDRVKKNLLFFTLHLPSAHFILIHPSCLLGRGICCLPSLCRPGFQTSILSHPFFSKQKDQTHGGV